MLRIADQIEIPEAEIDLSAVRAQGAGGQNVNKVASAVHLRFDVRACAHLPDDVKARLLQRPDRRISRDGVIVIKAQRFRSREKNRDDALARLRALLQSALAAPKKRLPTRPSRRAREKRLADKERRSRVKRLRGQVGD